MSYIGDWMNDEQIRLVHFVTYYQTGVVNHDWPKDLLDELWRQHYSHWLKLGMPKGPATEHSNHV